MSERKYNISLIGKRYVISSSVAPLRENILCPGLSEVLERLVSLGLDRAAALLAGQQLYKNGFVQVEIQDPQKFGLPKQARTLEPGSSAKSKARKPEINAPLKSVV